MSPAVAGTASSQCQCPLATLSPPAPHATKSDDLASLSRQLAKRLTLLMKCSNAHGSPSTFAPVPLGIGRVQFATDGFAAKPMLPLGLYLHPRRIFTTLPKLRPRGEDVDGREGVEGLAATVRPRTSTGPPDWSTTKRASYLSLSVQVVGAIHVLYA